MSQLSIDFETNLPEYDWDGINVSVCSILFRKENCYILLSCCGEEDFGVENGHYCANWKGVEFYMEDAAFNSLTEDWVQNDDFLYTIMQDAVPVAFYADEDALDEIGFTDTVTAKNVSVSLLVKENERTYEADELIPEEKFRNSESPNFWKHFVESIKPDKREFLMQALERPHMIEDIKLALTNEDVGDDLLAVTEEGKWLRDYLETRSEKECDAMYDHILEAYYENAELNCSYWRNRKEAAETVVRREWNKQRSEKEETER